MSSSWFGGWSGSQTATVPPTMTSTPVPLGTQPQSISSHNGFANAGGDGRYVVGEIVEYYSASQNTWILAKVLSVNPAGTYTLDCKPDVLPDKIRKRSTLDVGTSTMSAAEYKAGDVLEYYSASQGGWIPAKVIAVNANGTFSLDCKPDVPSDKIRRPVGMSSGTYTPPPRPGTQLGSQVGSFRSITSPGSPNRRVPTSRSIDINAPVQLLRVRRAGTQWQYEVCQEGAELLEQHGSRRIAVASICGLYRTGKSYLLNMLLERVQRGLPLFKVGDTTNACTEGLWLWGSTDSNDEQSPLLAFIDCEGFGSTESDRTRDAQLMTLCTLLSSVLVLNTKGALNESLFNSLALVCRFAEHIEERGNEASRPVLLWVLRDFMLELRDATGRPITPDEYLEKALLAAPTAAGVDQERGQAASEVRQSLLKFFSHRGCATLVQPAIEETQLQQLETVPYMSLRSEFRAGVEALRTQLIATCHSNPKTIGGQPLGCYSFVALMRQLVDALNSSKVLSMKGAWHTVQHTACGALADELRETAAQTLSALAAGRKLQGGAQLPMTGEQLHTVLRDQRHAVKSEWRERAVGDEAVRKEYWQELKDSLAQHDLTVRQQNARLADQQLQQMLDRWQEWLDDDASSPSVGDQLCQDMAQVMDRMPAAPLSRALRQAVEAAARRIAAARTAVKAHMEQSKEAQNKVAAWGEQANQQAGEARRELEVHHIELLSTQEHVKQVQNQEQSKRFQFGSKGQELEQAKAELQVLLQDMEDARQRNFELNAQLGIQVSKETSLRAELEQARADAAKTDAEKLASERCAEAAAEQSIAERQRLEAVLKQVRAQVEATAQTLASEREALRGENEQTRETHAQLVEEVRRQLDQERNVLQNDHERTREEHAKMVGDARAQLEDERRQMGTQADNDKARHLEAERQAGILEGQVQTLSTEASALRDRLADLQETIREAEAKADYEARQGERFRQDLEKARAEHAQAKADADDRVATKAAEYDREFEERFLPKEEDKAKPRCGCTVQ